MPDCSVGPQFVYDLAKTKMGAAVDMWLVTPLPELDGIHDGTPHGLLESRCPACVNTVLEMVEAM